MSNMYLTHYERKASKHPDHKEHVTTVNSGSETPRESVAYVQRNEMKSVWSFNNANTVVRQECENDQNNFQQYTVKVFNLLKTNIHFNKKPRGFMQNCFPMSVYLKCLREFLL